MSPSDQRLIELREQRSMLNTLLKEAFQPIAPPQMQQQGATPQIDPATGQPMAPQGPPVDPATGQPMQGSPPGPPIDPATGQPMQIDPATGQPVQGPPPGPPVDPATGQPMQIDPATGQPMPPGPPPIDPAQLEAMAQGMDQLAQALEQIATKISELEGTIKIHDKDLARVQDQVRNTEQEVYDLGKDMRMIVGQQA